MRLLSFLFLMLLALPCRADGPPPSGQPTAWLPPAGSTWLQVDTPSDGLPALTLGLRPITAVTASIRQVDNSAEADFAVELQQGHGLLPSLVLNTRGHGATMTERLDDLLLGWKAGPVFVSAGVGRAGNGDVRPVLDLHLPIHVPLLPLDDAWIRAGLGGPQGPTLAIGWSPDTDKTLSLSWHRRGGFVAGLVQQFGGPDQSHPYAGRPRRPDAGAWTDIGPFMSPAATLAAALPPDHPTSDQVTLASHRLGLPGVAVQIPGSDLDAWRRHRLSAAEIRLHAGLSRARTPTTLANHWELTLDTGLEAELASRLAPVGNRLSIGGRAHVLPWPGLILTVEGRVATAGAIPQPRYLPPSPGRDDAALYLERRYSLERAQVAYVRALTPSLDLLLEGGHLDPLYGGFGGELRYQPLTARWSFGGIIDHVWKRPPTTQTIYRGTGLTTGFINAGWEGREPGSRSELSIGRYLAGDWGGDVTIARQIGWGLDMALDATATTRSTRLGLTVTIPLAGLGQHVDVISRVKIRPLAREGAERLDRALSLADLRYAAGYARITEGWDRGFR